MSLQSKQAIIPIMNGQYERILAIEAPWGIRFAEGDMRPRIDYFHDAVRALTSGEGDPYAAHGRLSVEHLAYDVGQLRLISSKPLGLMDKTNTLAASTALVEQGKAGAAARKPDRATRQEIITLYKDYTVMFTALFAEIADMNFKTRQEDIDATVEDLALTQQVIEQLVNGDISKGQADAMLEGVEMDEIRERMQAAIASKKRVQLSDQVELNELTNAMEGRLNGDKKRIDDAHLNYVTGQLAVFEDAKDTVKRLAGQGLNLAGKFVEQAAARAQGQGQGRGV